MRKKSKASQNKKKIVSNQQIKPASTVGIVCSPEIIETSQLYHNLVNYSPYAMVLHYEGKIIYINPKGLALVGVKSPQEVVGQPISKFVHPDYLPIVAERLKKLKKVGEIASPKEEIYLRMDGSSIDVEVVTSLVEYKNSPAFQSIIIDISERKKAQRQLAEHVADLGKLNQIAIELSGLSFEADIFAVISERLKQLTGAVGVGVSFYDEAAKLLIVKNVYADINILDFLKKSIGENFIGTSIPINQQTYDLMLNNQGLSERMDLSGVTFGAIPKFVSDNFHKLFNISDFYGVSFILGNKLIATAVIALSKGKTGINRELVKTFSNIAAIAISRHLAGISLRESEEHYRNIVELSPDGIAVHSEGKIVFVNSTAKKIFGATNEEALVGRPAISIVHPDSQKLVTERIKALLEKGVPMPRAEEKFVRLDGTPIEVETAAAPTTYQGKRAVQVVVRDISERKRAEKALKESEEKFKAIAEFCPNMIFINLNGKVVYVNNKCSEILGYSKDEFLSPAFNFMDLIAAQDKEKVGRIFSSRLEGKETFSYEYMLMTKDGRMLNAINSAGMIIYDGQKALLGIVTDISQQKQVEEKLQKSEERLKKAQTMAHIGNWEWYPKSDVLHWEEENYKIFGLPPETKPSMKAFLDAIHPDDLGFVKKAIEEAMKGKPYDIDMRIRRPDQTERVIHAYGEFSRDAKGERERLFGTVQDITERKRAEQAIIDSEEKFKAIFEDSRDGLILADVKTKKFIMGNIAICKMLGYTKEELLCLDVNKIHPEKDVPWVLETFEKQTKGEIKVASLPVQRKDGSVLIADVSTSPLTLAGKKYLMGSFRDITERKKMEDALKEALKTKSAFTAMVSHELRTPLAAIKEGVAVVLDKVTGKINEEQAKYLSIAKNNVDRLDRLITSVLDFQKLESGKMEFKMENNNINEVVKEVHNAMMLVAKKRGLSFELELSDNLPQVKFDRDKIIEVLTNLINNAFKFTEKGGIAISTSSGDGLIQVMIKDTGIGIKEEDLPKLFLEFFQLHRKPGSTGLGLSICREIIERHKGKIWGESEFGKGSAFYFTLPIK